MDKLFKQLVDSTEPTMDSSLRGDLTSLYEHYQLNYENSLSFSHVEKYLYKIICENLVGDQLYTAQLSNLRDQLLLVHFIEGEELQPYLGILEIIIGAINWGSTVSATSQSIPKLAGLDCVEKWQTALQSARDLAVICPKLIEEYTLQNLERLYGTRLIVISDKAKILRREGYKIDCENGKVVIDESQARRIANQIEADIKSLGGIETLKRLFKKIEPCYQNEHGRYHLSPSHSSYFPRDYPVLFPVGYLLNLCVKYPHRSTLLAFESPDKSWCRILKNSIAFTHILDVRPYNLFVSGEHSRETLIPFLQNLAIYDNLFRPIQLRPSDVTKMIKGLFCDLTLTIDIKKMIKKLSKELSKELSCDLTLTIDIKNMIKELSKELSCDLTLTPLTIDIKKKLGWTPEQAATIAERIFKLTADNVNNLEPIIFQSEKLYDSDNSELKIENNIINKVLTLYSHTLNSVNLDFQIPQDISKVKLENYFQHKPLIRLSNNEYLFTNSSICSPAFYEAIILIIFEVKEKIISEVKEEINSEIYKKVGNKVDNQIHKRLEKKIEDKIDGEIREKLGKNTEDFIKKELEKRGIEVKSGHYDGSPDEIDILVEASDTLIFFEVKRKPLTRGARSGNDFALLIDLSKSLLASQFQINKHEIFIRNNGYISLKNDHSICQLNGRNIARVSVTLLDFGGFQDRTTIFDFLTNMLNAQLKLDGIENLSTKDAKDLKELQEKLLPEFQKQFNELVQLDPTKKGQPLALLTLGLKMYKRILFGDSRIAESLIEMAIILAYQPITQPFYDSWFLSLPQLLIILDNVNSSDDLKRELWKTRSSSAYFLDFYQEYYDAQKLFK
jgi:hypothetical protein